MYVFTKYSKQDKKFGKIIENPEKIKNIEFDNILNNLEKILQTSYKIDLEEIKNIDFKNLRWYLLGTRKKTISMVLVTKNYKERIATKFIKIAFEKFNTEKYDEIEKLLIKYDNPLNFDQLSILNEKVNIGSNILIDTMKDTLIHEENLNEFDKIGEDCVEVANEYKNNTNDLKKEMIARNRRFTKIIIIGVIILILITSLIIYKTFIK